MASEPPSVTRVRDAYRALYPYIWKAEPKALAAYTELATAIEDLIRGDDTSEDARDRAGKFCAWYRQAHATFRRAPNGTPIAYTPTMGIAQRDLGSATELAAAYDDETMQKIGEVWLRLSDDKLDFKANGGLRTISMMMTMVPKIVERLNGR